MISPNDAISEMEMGEKMDALKLGSKQDPQELDDQICELQAKFGCSLSEARRAAYILKLGKKHYATVLTTGTKMIRMI